MFKKLTNFFMSEATFIPRVLSISVMDFFAILDNKKIFYGVQKWFYELHIEAQGLRRKKLKLIVQGSSKMKVTDSE